MISNYEVRYKSRAVLGNSLFSGPWLYPMLVLLLTGVVSSAVSFIPIIPIIIAGPISVGVAHYFSGLLRRTVRYENISEVLNGASGDVGGNIITGLLFTVYIALWTLLFFIPGIIKTCSYALTFYIKKDHPEMSANEAIRESIRMMDGHKWQYFCLQLSFIGWYIVGMFCFGIGTYWAYAYNEAANAIFYEELLALEYTPSYAPPSADASFTSDGNGQDETGYKSI